MSELPKQLLAWLARLLPQQKVQGDDAVQAGQVRGDLHMDRSTRQSAVHVTTHVTHQHFYAPAPMPQAPPASAPPAPRHSAGARLSPEQRKVFVVMRRMPEHQYNQVLAFMRREMGTALVHELDAHQVYRLQRYVQTIQSNVERKRA